MTAGNQAEQPGDLGYGPKPPTWAAGTWPLRSPRENGDDFNDHIVLVDLATYI
jgi:hypothetical protein